MTPKLIGNPRCYCIDRKDEILSQKYREKFNKTYGLDDAVPDDMKILLSWKDSGHVAGK